MIHPSIIHSYTKFKHKNKKTKTESANDLFIIKNGNEFEILKKSLKNKTKFKILTFFFFPIVLLYVFIT